MTPSASPSPNSALITNFAVAVDLVALALRDGKLQALLVNRGIAPYQDGLALPGGFVLPNEDLPDAAVRELQEETGVTLSIGHLEQLASYGHPTRDPRGRVLSVAYLAFLRDLPAPVAGSDAAAATWLPLEKITAPLAFDHDQILTDGLERARAKFEYSTLAATFCPPEFTIAELRAVYETVWNIKLDPRNFHRKVVGTPGFLAATGNSTEGDRGRPAALYRAAGGATLNPPMLRNAS